MSYLSSVSTIFPSILGEVKPRCDGLYYQGNVELLGKPAISVIGSRTMSHYGAAVLAALIPGLVRAGLVIISGLALGVDGEAHRLMLQNKGQGIAVLGSSLEQIYPPKHLHIAEGLLANNGLLLSEYPVGTPGFKSNFPIRNRLIAALSQVTLIIEATEKSGTASTARAALELGREVCVVPGDITRPQSAGVLSLLKDGARPVSCVEDILSLYQLSLPLEAPNLLKPALTGSPATLYACISRGITRVEALVVATGWEVARVRTVLSVLELDGYITYRNAQWQTISLS